MRLTAKPEPIPLTIETFSIELADVKGASATLNFLWDKTRVPVKLTTDDVEQVSKQLDAAASAATPLDPRTAYQAAAFYYDNNKDMKQGGKVDRPGAGEEPRRLLHALQEGADSGEAWQQERSRRLGAKDDRHP